MKTAPCRGCGTAFGIYEEYCTICWRKAALDASAEHGSDKERIAALEAALRRCSIALTTVAQSILGVLTKKELVGTLEEARKLLGEVSE